MTVVLVTGASSGIGRSTAERFAADGADVALLARDAEALERAAEQVRAHGRRALVVPADVTDRAAVDHAIAVTVAELGGLDILVSCAAETVHGVFADTDPEDFDRTFHATFTGAVNVVRAALPHLERSEHAVAVVVGSLVSRTVLPTFTSYAAAKHALRGFLNTLRIELRASGSKVRIAQVHPGLVSTPLWGRTLGERPRRPPEGYKPEAIAAAIVHAAHHPRPERLVGGEAWFVDRLWALARRPVGEGVMVLLHRYFRSGGGKRHAPGLPVSRPSLLGKLRWRS